MTGQGLGEWPALGVAAEPRQRAGQGESHHRGGIVARQLHKLPGVRLGSLGKQRNGPIGMVPLAFVKEYTRFENMARGDDYYE